MKGEIDRDYFCSTYSKPMDKCSEAELCKSEVLAHGEMRGCARKHRKHPTPEQFKEEYGEDVPDDMPVWKRILFPKYPNGDWELSTFGCWKKYSIEKLQMVIACTPWGKPPNDWRPE